jgi:hypothetical protein
MQSLICPSKENHTAPPCPFVPSRERRLALVVMVVVVVVVWKQL